MQVEFRGKKLLRRCKERSETFRDCLISNLLLSIKKDNILLNCLRKICHLVFCNNRKGNYTHKMLEAVKCKIILLPKNL